jgi:uroporphyrinogen-III synthase
MLALQGVGVLVTRPEQQALPLCRLLEAAGATALRFPVIDIKPEVDAAELRARLGPIDAFDLVVFTSANAVRFGAPLLASLRTPPRRHQSAVQVAAIAPALAQALEQSGPQLAAIGPATAQALEQSGPQLAAIGPATAQALEQSGPLLAAIGPATAQALEQFGYRVTVASVGAFDSENLLMQPAFAQLAGRHVLIVKGVGGRELLQREISRRGAHVAIAEVYRREPTPHPDAALAALAAQFAAGAIQVITATSAEIAAGLAGSATPALRREFDRVRWVVPGARVAAALREHGVTAPVLQADTARDQDLVAAIARWRASVSGA